MSSVHSTIFPPHATQNHGDYGARLPLFQIQETPSQPALGNHTGLPLQLLCQRFDDDIAIRHGPVVALEHQRSGRRFSADNAARCLFFHYKVFMQNLVVKLHPEQLGLVRFFPG